MTDRDRLHERLDAASRRLAKASQGPWVLERDSEGQSHIRTHAGKGGHLYIRLDGQPASDRDVKFIAESRNALPTIIAALNVAGSETITVPKLGELEELAIGVSAAPWIPFLEGSQPIGGSSFIRVGGMDSDSEMYVWIDDQIATDADIDLIATARQDLPELLAEIRRTDNQS